MYIRCNSEDGITDIDHFDLPNFCIARIKNYIINNEPELIPDYGHDELIPGYGDEDSNADEFYYDSFALQRLFDDLDDLKDYVEKAISYCPDSECNRLEYVLEKINSKLEPEVYTWDSMTSNYEVCHIDPFGESAFNPIEVDTPESAITKWFILSAKHPSCVAICAKTRREAKELYTWVINNKELFEDLWNRYHVPYTFEYLYNYCVEHQYDSIQRGDQVAPFAAG